MDLPFLMLVMILLGIGLIMMFSASYATAYYDSKVADPLYYIKRQAMFAVVGVAVMYVVSKINYQTFRWMSVPALFSASFCCCWYLPRWAAATTAPGGG